VISAPTAPAYPTSSRSGPKNWDKLADEIGDDNEGGDDVNHFFQSLYKGADSDTQRAMLKSYQESNGTVLSTNWSEVGKGKVDTAPPDGMTAKKWDE
jgi:suppressor of G2 allele of SKP1